MKKIYLLLFTGLYFNASFCSEGNSVLNYGSLSSYTNVQQIELEPVLPVAVQVQQGRSAMERVCSGTPLLVMTVVSYLIAYGIHDKIGKLVGLGYTSYE